MQENEIKTCKYCSKSSVFYRAISNESVCKIHFIKTIENKIRRTIRKYKMFTPNDKVVVGVSGGKDSLALLYNIIQIQKKYHHSPKIEAILLDEGIKGYRNESCEIAKKMCEMWEIPLHIVSFQESFGASLDDLIPKLGNLNINACTICGTVRRRLLNDKAKELKADKLAIGHNLDDSVETFLQNILRNDIDKIYQNPPWGNPRDPDNFFIPRIKPLFTIPEAEIVRYCYFLDIPIQTIRCPYVFQFSILRKKVQDFINLLEEQSPEIKYNLLTANENFIQTLSVKQELSHQIEDTFNSLKIKENEKSNLEVHNNLEQSSISFQNQVCNICGSPRGPSRINCYYCELRKSLNLI